MTRQLAQIRALARGGISKKESRQALKAAAASYPPLSYDWQDASAELVRLSSSRPDPTAVATIRADWHLYSRAARREALALLSTVNESNAAHVYAGLALSAEAAELDTLPTRGFEDAPRHADILFPRLLSLVENPNLRWGPIALALVYFEEGLLVAGALDEHVAPVLGVHTQLLKDARTLQRVGDSRWVWDEDYGETRQLLGLILDFLGHTRTASGRDALRASLEINDPRIVLFAALSLLHYGDVADDSVWSAVAQSAETRNLLYRRLPQLGRADLYPSHLRSQAAFAESEMVNWLTFPTELGRAPDEIELMRVIEGPSGNDTVEYYLYRFRTLPPHWSADRGWMAGVSGPFLRRKSPSPDGLGGTFSTFAPWSSQSPEAHVANIVQLLEKWHAGQT